MSRTDAPRGAGDVLSGVDIELQQRALRGALWLAAFHAQQAGDETLRLTLTQLLVDVKKKHGASGPTV